MICSSLCVVDRWLTQHSRPVAGFVTLVHGGRLVGKRNGGHLVSKRKKLYVLKCSQSICICLHSLPARLRQLIALLDPSQQVYGVSIMYVVCVHETIVL